jgi:ribonuclease VapC
VFVDTSVFVAVLSEEPDAAEFAAIIARTSGLCTSPLVVLEAVMRLSTKLAIDPHDAQAAIDDMLALSNIGIVAITAADGRAAADAFARFGKGRGHPARLNIADCLSYACAKTRGLALLYKGEDFSRTDLAYRAP